MDMTGDMGLPVFLETLAVGSPQSVQGQDLAGNLADGKIVYEVHCGVATSTNFHGPIAQVKSDEKLLSSAEFGVVTSSMHAWLGRITDQELRDVVAHVRVLGQGGK